MKGPGYKLTGDVRRTWRCAKCGRERKLSGNVTTLYCGCQEESWMQIVAERIMSPRPLQRPSDVERRPIDFGIEAPPPAPVKPEATIIKSAVDRETIQTIEVTVAETKTDVTVVESVSEQTIETKLDVAPEDDWGDGIL